MLVSFVQSIRHDTLCSFTHFRLCFFYPGTSTCFAYHPLHSYMSRIFYHMTPRARSLISKVGGESNLDIVSCCAVRACVHARGVWSTEIPGKTRYSLVPFPLFGRPAFPFSLMRPYILFFPMKPYVPLRFQRFLCFLRFLCFR